MLRLRPHAEFELTDSSPGLVLGVTLGGQTIPMLFDSGSSGHFFDSQLSPHLGARVPARQGETLLGARMYEQRELPSDASLKGCSLQAQKVSLFDASILAEGFPKEVKGILGLALLRSGCWSFDFDSGKLTFATRVDPPPEGNQAAPETSLLYLPVTLADKPPIPFLLDTGAGCWGMLEEALFDALEASGMLTVMPGVHTQITPNGRRDDATHAVLKTIQAGGENFTSVVVHRGSKNLLGWQFFTTCNWIIDLSRSDIRMSRRQPSISASQSSTQTTNKPASR